MGKRHARKTNKPNSNTAAKKQPANDLSNARMHALHTGPNVSPRMEELMQRAIVRPNKDTLTIPVMDAIQRQMGNRFAVTLIQRAMSDDNSDYTSLRAQFDPNFNGNS